MQAIIMAGGKGTRLQSVTGNLIPKPLVPLNKKPLLDYIIDHAKQNGCDNIIICTGYMGDKVKEHIDKTDYGVSVKVSRESKPLGTAGGLHGIKDQLANEFFVLYGDIYTTINLKKMFLFHQQKKADATLAVHTSDHPQDSTIITSNKSAKLLGFIEKPGENWQQYGKVTTTPLYIVKKNILYFITKDKEVDFAKDVFPKMLKKNKKIFGYFTKEYAKDIGTPERYQKVLQILKK